MLRLEFYELTCRLLKLHRTIQHEFTTLKPWALFEPCWAPLVEVKWQKKLYAKCLRCFAVAECNASVERGTFWNAEHVECSVTCARMFFFFQWNVRWDKTPSKHFIYAGTLGICRSASSSGRANVEAYERCAIRRRLQQNRVNLGHSVDHISFDECHSRLLQHSPSTFSVRTLL